MKKIIALVLSLVLVVGAFAGCGKSDEKVIRYLNFKPEIAEVYEEISKAYFEATGIKLEVETAASGTYEQTLKARMATKEMPTLFQINGPVGYSAWSDYCADLSDTEIYSHLSDKTLAVTSGDGVYGIPYVVEGYGIIFNDAIMDKYFALSGRKTKITSTEEINNFEILSAVVEDMQANKDKLGIKGVFASTALKPGEDWRWSTHLANLPIYYEFKEGNIDLTSDKVKDITFSYGENFKNIFDLYLNNSTTPSSKLGSVDGNTSMAEFALGECAMVQNGNWGASQILGVEGNTVADSDIKFMPIYTGVEGEESQGLCIGTENFLCINSQVSEEEQKLAADFLMWLYGSETGKDFVTNDLKFITGFDTFSADEQPTDVLAKEVISWMTKPGIETVTWDFTVFPSQIFKNNFGSSLLKYAQGSMTWEEVSEQVVADWAKEYDQQD